MSTNIPKLNLAGLKKEMKRLSDPKRADFLGKFFKCGKGEYGEGDVFLGGINTPTLDKLVNKYCGLSLAEVQELLRSKYHEERMAALGILKKHFKKANGQEKKVIFTFYLRNTKYINNWDLVDVTAPKIVGAYLVENFKEKRKLDVLSNSKNLWERRISVIATFAFIREGSFEKTLEYAKKRLLDSEDLMHKAVGWALREVGKKNQKVEEDFLKMNYRKMPRTMLRYAIEKFPEPLRKKYLLGKI
jgi:3-methyladenine DNA glycosylase AlkD